MSSILNDVKHYLGLHSSDDAFDTPIIISINSALATLTQLGAGPIEGFEITGDTEQWESFYDDARLNSVKSFVYLRVKLEFDPPNSGFAQQAMERQIKELEFRINVVVDYG